MPVGRSARWLVGLMACTVAVGPSAIRSTHAQSRAMTKGEWAAYGGDRGNTKYSPLDQINRDNFGRLKIAWRWKSADGFLSKRVAGGGELWASSRFIFEPT